MCQAIVNLEANKLVLIIFWNLRQLGSLLSLQYQREIFTQNPCQTESKSAINQPTQWHAPWSRRSCYPPPRQAHGQPPLGPALPHSAQASPPSVKGGGAGAGGSQQFNPTALQSKDVVPENELISFLKTAALGMKHQRVRYKKVPLRITRT